MGSILEQAERAWAGDLDAPLAPRLELAEVAHGVAFVSSFANVAVIDAPRGLTLIDTGSWLVAHQQHGLVRAWSERPVVTALFTHGHLDHVSGLGPFDDEASRRRLARPHVIAHEGVVARFERYRRMAGLNERINRQQSGVPLRWPRSFRQPDQLFDNALTLDLGDGERLEIVHGKGETDDHAWAFLPSQRTLFTGDFFTWATPNAGNPQKVQRYPAEWAAALRRMVSCRAAVLCPGHGPPIVGESRVHRALTETAELLESLVEQTLSMMNRGATLDDVIHGVRPPAHLLARPYLRPVYDDPAFLVRNLWRLHGGWYDGNPAHLRPAPEAALARELAEVAHGVAFVSRFAHVAVLDAPRGLTLIDTGSWLVAHQ
ncbi:MAG: MBL fold metallo-hydrolase, partial [Myxococcales bacterium]